MEGVTETKFGAVTEGMTIQKLPHLEIHPIHSYQTRHSCGCQEVLANSNLI